MSIFGLSSLDTLISVLLIETGWWTKEFFEITLPSTLTYAQYDFGGHGDFISIQMYLSFFIYFSKFAIQGILWFALLRNHPHEHEGLLKFWYWTGIFLDATVVIWMVYFNVRQLETPTMLPIQLVPYFVMRGFIWILTTHLISDLSTDADKTLLPDGLISYIFDRTRLAVTLIILLVWEFFWYGFTTVGIILSQFFTRWNVLIPVPLDEGPITSSLIALTALGALLHLIGVVKRWTVFLKIWLSFYIIFNILGYVLLSLNEFFVAIQINSRNPGTLAITILTNTILPLFPLVIKITIVVASLKLLCRKETPVENDETTPLKNPETE